MYECLETDVDFYPSYIIATAVSLAEITPIIFKDQHRQLNYSSIVYLYNELFDEIIARVPSKAQKKRSIKKGQEFYERIYVKEDYDAINKNVYIRLSAFLDFYYEYIFKIPRIKNYVLPPYYEYYVSIKEGVLKKMKEECSDS